MSLPGGLRETGRRDRLSGGQIADAWRVTLADGTAAVVKETRYDARLEAEGLRALAAAGAPVPAVLAVDADTLVMEHVSGTADWTGLGTAMAELHATTGECFGWHRDNVIGSLPQANPPAADWPAFYAEHRIRPHLDAAALPAGVARRLAAAADGPLLELLDHAPAPSLVHGDLWSGNVVDGRWLIDPAVHHADREFELAFMELFGGFPDELWRAYEARLPPDPGWERRRPALQLYHLLIHVRLFGAGYVRPVVDRLDQLGW